MVDVESEGRNMKEYSQWTMPSCDRHVGVIWSSQMLVMLAARKHRRGALNQTQCELKPVSAIGAVLGR